MEAQRCRKIKIGTKEIKFGEFLPQKKTARELLLVLTNLGQAPISLHYLAIQLREVFVKIFAKRKGDYLTAAAANEAKHLMKLYF